MTRVAKSLLTGVLAVGTIGSQPIPLAAAIGDAETVTFSSVTRWDGRYQSSSGPARSCTGTIVDSDSGGASYRLSVSADCLDGFFIEEGDGYGTFDETVEVVYESGFVDGGGDSSREVRTSGDLGNPDYGQTFTADDEFDPFSLTVFDSTQFPCDVVLLEVASSNDGTFAGRNLECVGSPSGQDYWGNRSDHNYVGDPVNTFTGGLVDVRIDLEFAPSIFGMGWGRTYNSLNSEAGALGAGWTESYRHELEVVDGDTVTISTDDGRLLTFKRTTSGFTRPSAFDGELMEASDGSFSVANFDGSSWEFDASGRLERLLNWDDQEVEFTYVDDRLASVTSSTGVSLAIEYSGDRISQVTAEDGRSVGYAYDSDGDLQSVADSNGSASTYVTDESGLLLEIRDNEGVLITASTYDAERRVAGQSTGSGENAFFAYDTANRQTTVSYQPSGEVFVYSHDTEGRLVDVVDSNGSATTRSWDGDGNPTGLDDRSGAAIALSYDDSNNPSSATVTGYGTIAYLYDDANRVVAVTAPNGGVTSFGYTGDDRIPTTITDPLGAQTLNTVENGLLTATVDPDGVAMLYSYDAERRVTTSTDGLGGVTTQTYDSAGRPATTTTPLGLTTTYTYDAEGRVLEVTDAEGASTTYGYDESGRLLVGTDRSGATVTYAYDAEGRLSSETDSRGNVTTFDYDEFDELIAIVLPGDATWSSNLSNLSRPTSATDPIGRTTASAFDASGNPTSESDASGAVGSTNYGTNGRVEQVTDPNGNTTSYSYDSTGRLVQIEKPDATSTVMTYDDLDRLATITDARGGTTSLTYTPAGRLASMTDAGGNTHRYLYDERGYLAQIVDPVGNPTVLDLDADGRTEEITSPAGLSLVLEHDNESRPTQTIDSQGISTDFTYSARGDLTSIGRAGDGTISYAFDDLGMLTATDANGGEISFGYDGRLNVTSFTNQRGETDTYEFTDADELVSVLDPLNRETAYTYDTAGNVATVTSPTGDTVSNAYDPGRRVTSQTFNDGTQVDYTYDEMDRVTSISDPSGSTTYQYDSVGNLTQVVEPDGDTIAYTWDLAGNRTSIVYPDGTVVSYAYDNLNRLIEMSHPSGATTYEYDADSRLTSVTHPDGSQRLLDYTGAQLTTYSAGGDTWNLGYDDSGRLSTSVGAQDWNYGYDPAGQLISAEQDGRSWDYGYDAAGNLTTVVDDQEGSSAFSFDAADQLATVSSGDAGGTFRHDDAGRLIESADPDGTETAYEYDYRGQLTTIEISIPNGDPVDPEEVDPSICDTPTISGTNKADNITGTPGDDVIAGGNGDDTINGLGGDDVLCGGNGKDELIGGDGNDTLFGDNGKDTLDGGPGYDTLHGGNSPDVCDSGEAVSDDCELGQPGTDPAPGQGVDTQSWLRSYHPDGLLGSVTKVDNEGVETTWNLTWDRSMPVAQLIGWDGPEDVDLFRGLSLDFVSVDGQAAPAEVGPLGDIIGGGIAAADSYDPYGGGGSTFGLGYRGELHTGPVVYLRNRDLNPATGRFNTADALPPMIGQVATSAYSYANNDPIGRIDPLGLRPTDDDLRTLQEIHSRVLRDDLRGGSALPGNWSDMNFEQQTDYWMRVRLATFASVPPSWSRLSFEQKVSTFDSYGDRVLGDPPCVSSISTHWYSPGTYIANEASRQICEHPTATRRVTLALYGVAAVSLVVATAGLATTAMASGGTAFTFGGGASGGGFALAGGGTAGGGVTLVLSGELAAAGIGAIGLSLTGAVLAMAKDVPSAGGSSMIGANGTRTTSSTVYQGPKFRIDVENPNPGGRPGQMHIQPNGANQTSKWQYNFQTGRFDGLPRSLQRIVDRDPRVARAITHGLRILGVA